MSKNYDNSRANHNSSHYVPIYIKLCPARDMTIWQRGRNLYLFINRNIFRHLKLQMNEKYDKSRVNHNSLHYISIYIIPYLSQYLTIWLRRRNLYLYKQKYLSSFEFDDYFKNSRVNHNLLHYIPIYIILYLLRDMTILTEA